MTAPPFLDTDMPPLPGPWTGTFCYPPTLAVAVTAVALLTTPTPLMAVAEIPMGVDYTEASTVGRQLVEPMGDLMPRDVTSAEMVAWGRSMTGGDTSHMLDV
jgi:hypothetical protein